MAYDSLNENPDDIIRHRLEQQAIRTMPTPINRTQPVGARTPLAQAPPPTPYAGRYGSAGAAIQDAYRRDLGRDASDDEIGSHIGYGRYTQAPNLQHATRSIFESAEARARRPASQGGTAPDAPSGAGAAGAGTTSASGAPGGGPLGGSNTGVAGGPDRSGTTPGGAGGADMEWRKTLSYGGGPGTLSGFNTAGYDNDKAANSVKNTFGRIAQRYPNTPEGLRQVVNDPDFKRAFPNARLLEGGVGDKIDFGGVLSDFESGSPVGVVDVGQAFDLANNSGTSWAWMPDGEGDPGMGGDGGGGGNFGMDLRSILAGEDPLDDIMKRISDLNGGRTPDAEQQALMDILRGI